MASGLRTEIDELDQLLDKLLKLPIDRVTSSSTVLPLQRGPALNLVIEEEEPGVLPIEQPTIQKQTDELRLVRSSLPSLDKVSTEDEATTPSPIIHLAVQQNAESRHHTQSSAFDVTLEPVPIQKSVVETSPTTLSPSAPWLDDEPLPVPTTSSGPKVEIIQGPYSEVVMASNHDEEDNHSKAKKHSILFALLWFWTWLFDNTLGAWFPFFRRPNVKFLLGLMGMVLFAISIYIVWQGIHR